MFHFLLYWLYTLGITNKELKGEDNLSKIINGFRSIIFNVLFFLSAIISFTVFTITTLASSDTALRVCVKYWIKSSLFMARWVMGIKIEFRNLDKLPKEGAMIVAAKHQSNLDPLLIYTVRSDVTAFAKKELFDLPVMGLLLKKMRIICVDRGKGTAHKSMDVVKDQVIGFKRPLLVYPEGTRVPVGQRRKLKSGAYFAQESHDLPVYTVATNSGCFWTRGFWHKSGTVVFEVDGPLGDNLSRSEFMAELHEKVVVRSDILMRESGFDMPPLEDQPMRGKGRH